MPMVAVRQTREYLEWFSRLRDHKAKSAILARIRRLSLGNKGDAESVGDGVGELRIRVGAGYRGYFAYRGRESVVLLCGGDKSSQGQDIARAKAMAAGLED
jgi:putative addiction module killer protein